MTRRFDPQLLPPAPDLSLESGLWELGVGRIGGIDEAGRGALAGPVAAAVLVLPADPAVGARLSGLRDSKALSAAGRNAWKSRIEQVAEDYGVGFASSEEIDLLGIVPATRLAAQRALDSLSSPPGHLALDYLFLPENPLPQTSLIKGDARSLSIAGASVLAKVARDEVMRTLDGRYPQFGFAAHKGYGTASHRSAIDLYGPTPDHRLSFAPVALQRASAAT
jgi:ribonuclease HII